MTPSNSTQSYLENSLSHQTSQKTKNLWDNLPEEIKTHILNNTDLLTQIIHGISKPCKIQNLSEYSEEAQELWTIAFKNNLSMDILRLLHPDAVPEVHDGLLHVNTKEMHQLICLLNPSRRTFPEAKWFKHNRYSSTDTHRNELNEVDTSEIRKSFIHIPMRNGWWDLIEEVSSRFPMICAKLALKFHHSKYFIHLVQNFGVDPHAFYTNDIQQGEKKTDTLALICMSGDLEVVKFLMTEKGSQVTDLCKKNACQSGNLELVKFLFENVPEPTTTSTTPDTKKNPYHDPSNDPPTSLMEASISKGHLHILKYLHEENQFPLTYTFRALEEAIMNGHTTVLRYVLPKGRNLGPRGEAVKVTPQMLFNAAYRGHYDAVLLCIRYEAYTGISRDLLMAVVLTGNLKVLKTLLEKEPDAFDPTVVWNACQYGRLEMLKYMHDQKKDDILRPSNSDTFFAAATNEPSHRYLDIACENKNFGIVKYLVEHMGIQPSEESMEKAVPHFGMVRYLHTTSKAPCSEKVLHNAAMWGRLDILEYCRLNFPDIHCGSWGFAVAVQNEEFEVLKYLKEHYHSTEYGFYQSASLGYYASNTENLEILEYIMANEMGDHEEALKVAARRGDFSYFQKVYNIALKFPPPPELLDSEPTPWNPITESHLHTASETGNLNIVQFIHKKLGTDMDDGFYHNPLELSIAAREGHHSVVRFLAENLAMNYNEEKIQKAFEEACWYGHLDVVKFLLETFSKVLKEGSNAVDAGLDVACIDVQPSVIEFLVPMCSEKGVEAARKRLEYEDQGGWKAEIVEMYLSCQK
jgi:ankyrin repeat protein